MFSLILVIISIALAVLLAIASIYYGGDAFLRSEESVRISRDLNEIEQLRAAVTLYAQDKGEKATNIQQLVDNNYLKAGMRRNWMLGEGYGFSADQADVDDAYCLAFNKKTLGLEYIPECADPQWAATPVCCNPS